MTRLPQIVVAASVLALAGPASGDVIPAERVKAMVESGQILPLQQIVKMHEAELHGRIVEIELEQEGERLVYEFKILPAQGQYRKIEIDAASGEVVRRK